MQQTNVINTKVGITWLERWFTKNCMRDPNVVMLITDNYQNKILSDKVIGIKFSGIL